MSRADAVVIGIGNVFRQDDGIGPAAVAALRSRPLAGVRLVDSDGEPTGLLDTWHDADVAVIIDAVRCAPTVPGRLHRLVLPATGTTPTAAGTHGLGLAEAVALAGSLGRLPRRLVVCGVEAARTGYGPELSPAVRAALPRLVRIVLAELAGVRCPVPPPPFGTVSTTTPDGPMAR